VTDPLLFVLSLGLLLVLDGLTVAARAAIMNTSPARLLAQRAQMEPQVNRTLALFHALPRLQAGLGLAQTILRFLTAGWILFFLLSRTATTATAITAILLLAAFLVFLLERSVERQALDHSEEWALRLTPFTRLLMLALAPLLVLPLGLAREPKIALEGNGAVTEDELKTLVDAGQEDGVLEQEERQMIHSIIELGDTLVREIMVPRIDTIALEVNTSVMDAVDVLLQSGYSRLPVYEETVDTVLGLLYAKDLLPVWRKGESLDSLRPLLRPAYFVPEAKKAHALLTEMQSQRIHMAIIVDEYGGVAGLVTLEDIVEEILGEIQDEFDQGEESPYHELPGGDYIFQGKVDLDDFNEVVDGHLPKEEADTIGGFIYSQLGRVPSSGERIQVDDLLLTVEQVIGRRIRKVRAERILSTSNRKEEEEPHVDG
jgi:CBS domain containing-hemolysin-like protein